MDADDAATLERLARHVRIAIVWCAPCGWRFLADFLNRHASTFARAWGRT